MTASVANLIAADPWVGGVLILGRGFSRITNGDLAGPIALRLVQRAYICYECGEDFAQEGVLLALRVSRVIARRDRSEPADEA